MAKIEVRGAADVEVVVKIDDEAGVELEAGRGVYWGIGSADLVAGR